MSGAACSVLAVGAYRGERGEAGADSELPELFDVRGERGESIRALEPRREPLIGFFPEGGLRDMAGAPGTDRMALWQRDVRKAASGVSKGKRAQGTSDEHDMHMYVHVGAQRVREA